MPYLLMIRTLIASAFQTGYLSVESEGLLHQVLVTRCYQSDDLKALAALYEAIHTGQIKREASSKNLIELPALNKSN
ncbi:hypothetical protein Anacy_3368 [Anabaena cylindrica PCC 7122]|uniref:Uncharacterized protein n=2 Tax=Nostocaceae TaxID=1162 RepID=K9ZHW2_ANACC|nr:hypothetical protein Anacy_3368 [Anabaena cylindrica PCC 7122]BAY04219.1 hypothetical protein NIES19_34820 [Anabaena cylindrica PCC 7122]